MAVAMSEDSHGRRNAPKKRDKASVPQQIILIRKIEQTGILIRLLP